MKVIVDFGAGELERLAAAGHALGSAYRVRVRIYTAEQADAVMVPRSALFRGAAGVWQVFAVRKGKAELVEVTLGLTNEENVTIETGLEPNEQVVLAPPASLQDGMKVTPHVLR